MTMNNQRWIAFLLVSFLITGMSCHRTEINVRDDFENPELSNIWSTSRMELHSFKIQSKIVRNGLHAANIAIRTGDVVETATNGNNVSERDELMENWSLWSVEENKYEYKFSIFLPDSFPIIPVRLVLAQWKQFCPIGVCSEYSPVLALRYQSGKIFFTVQTDSVRHTLWKLDDDVRNRWLDFTFQIRFSRKGNGEVDGFLNGKHIINYTGVTSYSETLWYLAIKNRYYFKMGLYRDRIPEPMFIYIDQYAKKEISE